MNWPEPILIQESGGPPPNDVPVPMPLPRTPCAACGKPFVVGETRPPWRWSGYVTEVYRDAGGDPGEPFVVPAGWTPRYWHFWCDPTPTLTSRPHAVRLAKALHEQPRVTNITRPFKGSGKRQEQPSVGGSD